MLRRIKPFENFDLPYKLSEIESFENVCLTSGIHKMHFLASPRVKSFKIDSANLDWQVKKDWFVSIWQDFQRVHVIFTNPIRPRESLVVLVKCHIPFHSNHDQVMIWINSLKIWKSCAHDLNGIFRKSGFVITILNESLKPRDLCSWYPSNLLSLHDLSWIQGIPSPFHIFTNLFNKPCILGYDTNPTQILVKSLGDETIWTARKICSTLWKFSLPLLIAHLLLGILEQAAVPNFFFNAYH